MINSEEQEAIGYFVETAQIAAEEVSIMTQDIVDGYASHRYPSEVEATGALAGVLTECAPDHIAHRVDRLQHNNIDFRARVLSTGYRGSEESHAGADLAISLGLNFEDYTDIKSVLVQNKVYRRRSDTSSYNTQLLEEEALNMLRHTSDSFVFVFPFEQEMVALPAITIIGRTVAGDTIPGNYPEQHPKKNIQQFFENLVLGFIGDVSLVPPALSPLSWRDPDLSSDDLSEFPADRILQIRIESEDAPAYEPSMEEYWWETKS